MQAQILRLVNEKRDVMPGLSSAEKKARLARMSYTDFVTKTWGLDPAVVGIYQTRTYGLFGFGVDAVPAQDAWALGLPGFQGMNLEPGNGPGQNYDSIRHPERRGVLLPLPRRERLGGPPAGAAADPGGRARARPPTTW